MSTLARHFASASPRTQVALVISAIAFVRANRSNIIGAHLFLLYWIASLPAYVAAGVAGSILTALSGKKDTESLSVREDAVLRLLRYVCDLNASARHAMVLTTAKLTQLTAAIQLTPASADHGFPGGLWMHSGKLGDISSIKNDASVVVLVYAHGGGFSFGGSGMYAGMHAHLAQRISSSSNNKTRLLVLSIDYSLTVNTTALCPVPITQALAAYDYVTRTLGVPASRVILGGDSAGGNIALSVAIQIRETSRAAPLALLLISPWVNLLQVKTTAAAAARPARDMFAGNTLNTMARLYISGMADSPSSYDVLNASYNSNSSSNSKHHLSSPITADLQHLPPMLINYGGREVLRPDIEALIAKAKAASSSNSVTVVMDERLFHVYVTVGDLLGAAAFTGLDRIADWVLALRAK